MASDSAERGRTDPDTQPQANHFEVYWIFMLQRKIYHENMLLAQTPLKAYNVTWHLPP